MSAVSWMFALTSAATVAVTAGQSFSSTGFTNTTTVSDSTSSRAATETPLPTANNTSRNPVQVCDDLQSSYWNASYYYKPTSWTTTTTEITYDRTDYYTTSTWTCTSTCKETAPYGSNICYADSLTILTTSSDVLNTVITQAESSGEDYPGPSPTCSVAISDCTSLWSSYSSASTAWKSASGVTPPPAGITASPIKPFCKTCVAMQCTIQRAQADLYFWPVPANATTRDMCASMPTSTWAERPPDFPNTTWTEVTTGPYAVVNGNTFYSGNVYVYLSSIEATWPCRSAQTYYNSILTLASSDIFTQRGYPINNIPWSINYADFNEPVPYSAWYGAPTCNIRLPACSVVYPGEYKPQMVMPAAIRQIHPEWADCSLGFFGLDDPPIALKSAGNFLSSSSSVPAVPITTPNAPPSPSSTRATPADPPSPPTSAPTARPPVPSDEPSDPGDPPSKPDDPEDPPSTPTDPEDPSDPNTPGSPPAGPDNSSPPNNPPSTPTGPGSLPNSPPGSPNSPPNSPGSPPNSPGSPPNAPNSPPNAPGSPPNSPNNPNVPPNNGQPAATNPPSNNPNPNPSPITITSAPAGPILANPTGGIILPGTTLRPGDPALTISGTTISAAPSGILIIDPNGTQTIPFPSAQSQNGVAPGGIGVSITVGDATFTVGPSGVVVGSGTTLTPGGSAVVVDGSTWSAAPTGLVVIGASGTQTIPLPVSPQTGAGAGNGQVTFTVGDETLVAGPSGVVVAPGTTLHPGDAPVTIDGTTISVGPSGAVVVGSGGVSSTLAVPTAGEQGASVVTLTLGNGDVVTATSSDGVVVFGSVTLSVDGPAATMSDGLVVSLGTSGVVVGTGTAVSTAVFAEPTAAETGSGGFPGAGSRVQVRWYGAVLGMLVGAVVMV